MAAWFARCGLLVVVVVVLLLGTGPVHMQLLCDLDHNCFKTRPVPTTKKEKILVCTSWIPYIKQCLENVREYCPKDRVSPDTLQKLLYKAIYDCSEGVAVRMRPELLFVTAAALLLVSMLSAP